MKKTIASAIVGFGGMGHHHATRYAGCRNVRLVAICDIDPARLAVAETETNLGSSGRLDVAGLRLYASYEELVRAEKGRVDMIDLCVPTPLHATLACRALRDGFHVLSEKPMARTIAECDRMLAAAKESGRLHMVAQCLRFSPHYRLLEETVRSGRLGALRRLDLHRFGGMPWSDWYWDHRKSGGAVLDLQMHDLDFANLLLGTPRTLRTEGLRGPSGGWDEVLTRLRYANSDALVTTEASWLRDRFTWGFEAVFEQGLLLCHDGEIRERTLDRHAEERICPVGDTDMYAAEIDYFADCVRRGMAPERCLPESTRESVRLVRLQMRSAARGGAWLRA